MTGPAVKANPGRARQRARDVIAEFGVERAPVPIDRIIKRKAISLEYAPFEDDLSGVAYIDNGVAMIGVNAMHHPNRQRFTAAHELGHHLLHEDEITGAVHVDKGMMRALFRDDESSQGINRLEIEANAFASELLMPRSLLVAALNGDSVDIEDNAHIEALAKKFKVSEAAMRFRLSGLMSEAESA